MRRGRRLCHARIHWRRLLKGNGSLPIQRQLEILRILFNQQPITPGLPDHRHHHRHPVVFRLCRWLLVPRALL